MRKISRFLGTHYLIRTVLVGTTGLLVSGCSLDSARFKRDPFQDPFTTGTISEPSRQPPNHDRSNWNSRPAIQPVTVSPPTQPVVTVGQGGWTSVGGTQIMVGEGDTVTSISHRYGVPERAILSANGLSSGTQISSGQTLVIPVYDATGKNVTVGQAQKVVTNAPQYSQTAPIPATRPKFKDDHNTRTEGNKVKDISSNKPSTKEQSASAEKIPQPRLERKEVQVASLQSQPPQNNAKVTPASASVSSNSRGTSKLISADGNYFRWPAKGRIIAGFGTSGNEGINIALPEGAAVRAVEAGTVTYVGDEIKNFGHLVVIRHDNGYVSAYAHNSELAVKRGERVARGQIVAKSGRSGNVTSPQLHFELRKGGTPIDPVPRLSGS